jgi:hypothetical protein
MFALADTVGDPVDQALAAGDSGPAPPLVTRNRSDPSRPPPAADSVHGHRRDHLLRGWWSCELGGLALVVIGIRDDRRRAERLFAAPIKLRLPKRSYPARMAGSSVATPSWATGGFGSRPQMSSIVRHIQRLEASVANGIIGLRKAVDTERDYLADALHREQVEGDNQLRENLRDVLTGSVTGRLIGAMLLASGILLSVAGSVLSAAS